MKYQDTSREAWRSMMSAGAFLDREIMGALAASKNGLTCQAIEGRIDREHQAVSGNLRHLVEKGWVEDSGLYGVTRSGRRAKVWRIAPNPKPDAA